MEIYPGKLTHWYQENDTCFFVADNDVVLAVYVLSDSIFRFRYATNRFFPRDFSYAIDEKFKPSVKSLRIREGNLRVSITTESLICKIDKANLSVQISDRHGHMLMEDEKGFHWEKDHFGGDIVQMSKKAHPEEQYFGLGDKSKSLNLRGNRLQNWCTDCFGYGADSDPLYRAVPFYFSLRKGIATGIFFDNSFRTHFDFAAERPEATSFWAHGGEMNYYFFYGPSLIEVAQNYTLLTGRPELPPLWALGYQQCRWGYYPESRVKEIANEFRDRQIPCDAIHLDIDYMDGYRCFTWNFDHFPEPAKMIGELADDGFKTVVIIDPGIKIDLDYEVFKEGLENDYFCRRQDGPYAQGAVWPGQCYFPDYTNPKVREWWAGLFKDLIRKYGVRGVWNDMNEPATFDLEGRTLNLDVRHDYDGNSCSHRKAHNIYGMQMSRATYEGVKEYAYPNRPIMITRATYSGGQRFASAWTGDNTSSWEHIRLANLQCQRMSVSGFSFIGSDVGGFNSIADGELLVRWLQLAAFHPLFRNHTMGNNIDGHEAIDADAVEEKSRQFNTDQEPWSFGEEYEVHAKKAIEFRYQLLPVMYTAFWQHVTYGTPVLRPLSFMDQHNTDTFTRMDEFSLGDHLLICPILGPGITQRNMYLPYGKWYNFYTDELHEGRQEIEVECPLDFIPLFVRAGGIVPMYPVMQYVGEKAIEELTLHVYYLHYGDMTSTLYEDAGDGYDYEQGKYLKRDFRVAGAPSSLRIYQQTAGHFKPSYDRIKLVIHGLPYQIARVAINGEVSDFFTMQYEGDHPVLMVPPDFDQVDILDGN